MEQSIDQNTFLIMPMSKNVYLAPGNTYTYSITVINPADAEKDLEYEISVMPYGVKGENYTADLQTVGARNGIMEWIEISEPTGTIAPNNSKEIEYTITVPEDALPGGQYAAIAVRTADGHTAENKTSIGSIFELTSVIYGTVEGKIKHGGEIKDNHIDFWYFSKPIATSSAVNNTGNVHEFACIDIEAQNLITKEVIYHTSEDESSEVIMPETEKYFQREIKNTPLLGVFKITQSISYRGDKSIVEKNVVICPLWFLAICILVICGIISIIVSSIVKAKRKGF